MSYKANSNIIKVSTAGVVGANGLIVGNPDTTAKDASAALEIESTTGGLLLPRVTTVQRDAIASPTQGLLVENTTTDRAEVKAFSGWQRVMTEETAAITESQIVNSAVTTNKIANNSVTQQKLGAANYNMSGSSGNFVLSSTTLTDVTNLSVTITTTGRPVAIKFMSAADGSGGAFGNIYAYRPSSTQAKASIHILRNGVSIAAYVLLLSHTTSGSIEVDVPAGGLNYIDIVGAGTYTYKLQAKVDVAGQVGVQYVKMFCGEI